jgi:hypothetical protein
MNWEIGMRNLRKKAEDRRKMTGSRNQRFYMK